MKIIKSQLRAVVERCTEIEFHHEGQKKHLFVFENLDSRGVPYEQWVQNWECDDITHLFNYQDRKEITEALYEHYKCKSNSSD